MAAAQDRSSNVLLLCADQFRIDALGRAGNRVVYGLVSHIDDHVGRILDMLDQTGLREQTVVVFSADHGGVLSDHGHRRKRSFHEGAAKVRLPPSCPVRLPAGRICDKLVGLTDILPNSTKVGKGTTPPVVSGRSLVPLLEDTGALWDRTVFGTHGGFRGIVQMDDWRISTSFMVRWRQWEYVYYVNGGREQLFDLQEDPQELHTMVQDRPRLCEAVKQDQTRHLVSGNFEAYVDNDALLELLFQAEFNEVVVQPNRTTEHTVEAGRS